MLRPETIMSLAQAEPLAAVRAEVYYPLHAGWLDLSISNTVVFMWLAVLASVLLLRWMASRSDMVPRKPQLLVEMLYLFVSEIAASNIRHHSPQYVPAMFTLFVFILGCNLIGLVPGAFTPTSQLAVTGTLAAGVFLYATWLRLRCHGRHFFSTFAPHGVPVLVLPLLVPIELLSFLARPVTLSLRLFANMTAGHTSLGVLAVLGFAAPWFLQWLPLGFTAVQIALEIIIAFIQAYIFVTLACVYIDDALAVH